MGKRAKRGSEPVRPAAGPPAESKAPTLKDMVGADVLAKLKAQAEALRAHEAAERERQKAEAEERRKEEQKRLDNDFGYLLEQSGMDWKKFK